MLHFYYQNQNYVLIHIPKTSGRYIRSHITINRSTCRVVKKFWETKNNFDFAHIPYCLADNFFNTNIDYKYVTFVRNPYDRLISAFYYLNSKKKVNVDDFKKFVKTELINFTFDNSYSSQIIHYYPQYKFLINKNDVLDDKIQIFKADEYKNEFMEFRKLKVVKYELKKFYDNESLSIVNNIYKRDFIEFNYPVVIYNGM